MQQKIIRATTNIKMVKDRLEAWAENADYSGRTTRDKREEARYYNQRNNYKKLVARLAYVLELLGDDTDAERIKGS